MIEANSLASIDSSLVDEAVIGAMALLIEGEACEVSCRTPADSDDVTVAVYCDSHQQSAVILRCSQALAKEVAGRMLELEPDEIVTADILDATGELVNVIAGNLRGLILSPGAMTAPFVMEQQAFEQLTGVPRNTYSLSGEPMQIVRL